MTRALYLLGPPGVGKSSTMGCLLAPWVIGPYERLTDREMFGHILVQPEMGLDGVYLGHLRPEFPGTDALSMSVQPQALKWLAQTDGAVDYIYGEGARLGNAAFLEALSRRSRLTVVYLTAEEHVLELRLLNRPDTAQHKTGRVGRSQDRGWQDAQATRNLNLYHKMCEMALSHATLEVLKIDTTDLDPLQVALSIVGAINGSL